VRLSFHWLCVTIQVANRIAGSLAAGVQSVIGNVAAGSIFAVCQSVGAGAALPLAGYVGGGLVGGVAAAAGASGTERQREAKENDAVETVAARPDVPRGCPICHSSVM
jgi:hypothetical protein